MNPISRRQLLRKVICAATAASLPSFSASAETVAPPQVKPAVGTVPATTAAAIGSPAPAPTAPFTLPPLPYAYDALEPHIDTETMKVHHDKHHAAYVAKLNAAVTEEPSLAGKKIEDLLWNGLSPRSARQLPLAIRNNGGGHYNHSLFWQTIAPTVERSRRGTALGTQIAQTFSSFEKFQDEFTKAALGLFGSGWVWLSLGEQRRLEIESTPNQDNPLMFGRQPVFGLDLWEHAYYLKHENRRPEYIEAFWKVLNWDFISDRYSKLAS